MKLNLNIKQNAKKYAGVLVLTGALFAAVSLSPATAAITRDAALPADSVTGPVQIKDGTVYGADLAPGMVAWFTGGPYNNTVRSATIIDGQVNEADLSDAVKTKLNTGGGTTGPTGPAGPAGPAGPQGPKGDPGDSAIVSVSAMSTLTNRPDSGLHGTWATDTLTRNASITRQSAVPASNCGPTATKCWFYTGTIADNGTFTTVTGADSPQAGTAISGTVNGTVVGVAKFEFYATSDEPNPALVDATVNGSAIPTARWGAEFFADGTTVTDLDHKDWGWTYNASATCETWVNAKAGNTGDITGVNAC